MEEQSTILHAAPASDGRICSAMPHGCQARVRTSFRPLSIGSGRLHRIWPCAALRQGILFQPPIESKETKDNRFQASSFVGTKASAIPALRRNFSLHSFD